MRVLIRNTALDGRPLEGDGEVFTGETVTDVVLAMKGATLFSDQRDLEDYIDMVLRNAKMLAGVELTVRGDTPEEKAASFLDALIKHGLAEVQDDKPARIPIPALVWQGIDADRLSGLTNVLDRPVVARLAGELGYPDAARWIEEHPSQPPTGLRRRAQARPVAPCTGRFSPSTIPLIRLPAIDRLEGFHPGGPCLYRRVLVPVRANATVLPTWLYVVGDRWTGSVKELTGEIWR